MFVFTGNVFVDLISVIVAIFAVVYTYVRWIFGHWKRKNIPYFEPSFPFGNISGLKNEVSITDVVFETGKKAKAEGWKYFGMYLSTSSFFVPLDLEMIKNIMTKDFKHFTDRGLYFDEKQDPLTANLFVVGGTKWKNLRIKLTPTFTSGKMKGMFQTLVNCGSLLETFLKQHDTSGPIDIKHAFVCFTTDIICSCAFGLDCNTFKEPNSPFLTYGRKMLSQKAVDQFVPFVANSFPKLAKILRLRIVPADVTEFFSRIVTETVNYREKHGVSRKDFLQLLIDNQNNNNDETIKGDTTFTMNEMIAQCFVFFVAGFETSSTTMTFALFELATHPDIQEKVRDELLRVLKKYENKICYDALKELDYMEQVINETLRKYPALPFVTRQCTETYKIPDTDITLEKGTNVIIPIQNIHYDEKIFENPMEFDPNRFSPENKRDRNSYAHIPFGEGPRICIGMRFGIMQTKVGLATVLRNYRLTLSPDTKVPLQMLPGSFVPCTKGGIWLNLEEL